jgi:glycerol-3-phosphate O-acyltransferase
VVDKLDHRADLLPNLLTAETINRAVSELSEHKRVLTERATTRIEGLADGVKTIADQAIEIATKTTEETKAAVGTKISTAREWLSTDPVRRYLAER